MGFQEVYDAAAEAWAAAVRAHNSGIDDAIASCRSKINKLQALHDSLLEFKGKCETYYDNFNTINSSKKRKITNLKTTVLNSSVKDTYISSMNMTFYQMANKRMEQDLWVPFGILIDDKLQYYKDEIAKLEAKIRDLQNDYW